MQVYKLEPRGYDIQVGKLVQLKHFELALEIAVSHHHTWNHVIVT